MRAVGDLDWERLGRYVRHRRDKELDMTQLDVQTAGGPSTATMRLIEGGHQKQGYSSMTIAALETALGWKHGSATKILVGGEPELDTKEPEPEPPPRPEPVTVAAIKSDDRLTDEDKARLIDFYERMRDDGNGHGRGKHLA